MNDKRDRILDAAEIIFARHGFYSAKVADVAKEAGVADGTIYLYFKSKDDLLISLFESRMERVNGFLAAAVANLRSPTEQLRVFIRTYLTLVHDQPSVAEVLTVELRQSSKFMKEYGNPRFADFIRQLAAIITAGQAGGEFETSIPALFGARMIFGILDELATAWLLASDRTTSNGNGAPRSKKFDIVRAADWATTLVTRGVSAPSTILATRKP